MVRIADDHLSWLLGDEGREHLKKLPEKPHIPNERGTESGTLGARSATFGDTNSGGSSGAIDPDLQAVIDAWPKLPAGKRRVILGIAKGGRS